jgi:ribosomal protein S18 acetylase RimI-like enzyme
MMLIQPAQLHHYPAIAMLTIEAYQEYAADLTPDAWITLRTNLQTIETSAHRTPFLIVIRSGELAGSVGYCPPGNSRSPIPKDWASVLLLAVSPRYRRQGVGRSLLQSCIQQARKDGAQTVGLFTSEVMTGARQLYESFGFYKDCELPQRLGLRYWRYRLDLTAILPSG